MGGKRKSHSAAFEAPVALAAVKGDQTIHELASHYGVHPTLSHAWEKQLPAGAAAVFAAGAKAPGPPEGKTAELFESRLMNSMSVTDYMEHETMTPHLYQLIERAALPLRGVESTFAPDSTGFSTSRFVRWFDEKYGRERSGREWGKAHAVVGTKTNIITSCVIDTPTAGDSPQLKPMLEATAANGFTIGDVCADKAYLSYENMDLVARLGGTPFIPFEAYNIPGEPGTVWERMHGYFPFRREEFLKKVSPEEQRREPVRDGESQVPG